MPKSHNNLHDKFVKDMLSDKELATAFLTEMLPIEVTKCINFSSLTYSNNSYITTEMNEIFSDLLLDIKLKTGENIRVAILLEHKSYIDAKAPFQVLRYLAEAYHKQITSKESLRPILPLIYYHGKKKWEYKQLEQSFELYPDIFKKYLPIYLSEFVSLQELNEDTLSKLRNSMLHAALEIQRYDNNPMALLKRLRHITENLNPYINSGFAIKILIYLLQTTEVTLDDFKQNLPEPIVDKVMSTYDLIINEGIEKGIEKGIEQGIEQGIEKGIEKGIEQGIEKGIEKGIEQGIEKTVLNAFDNKIDLATIQVITGESIKKIKAILKKNNKI